MFSLHLGPFGEIKHCLTLLPRVANHVLEKEVPLVFLQRHIIHGHNRSDSGVCV